MFIKVCVERELLNILISLFYVVILTLYFQLLYNDTPFIISFTSEFTNEQARKNSAWFKDARVNLQGWQLLQTEQI